MKTLVLYLLFNGLIFGLVYGFINTYFAWYLNIILFIILFIAKLSIYHEFVDHISNGQVTKFMSLWKDKLKDEIDLSISGKDQELINSFFNLSLISLGLNFIETSIILASIKFKTIYIIGVYLTFVCLNVLTGMMLVERVEKFFGKNK